MMGLIDRIFGRQSAGQAAPRLLPTVVQEQQSGTPELGTDDGWYVPKDGNRDRFIGLDGIPALHLIRYRDSGGELVLRLCEDATGLLVSPTDTRLPKAGIYVSQLRGEAYHQASCRAGDFRPGMPVRLVREPDNQFDGNAVAVYDQTGQFMAAYVNKQKARTLARLMDSGQSLEAISIRGTGPGIVCDQVAVLAAMREVLQRLLEPRPAHLPTPAHERS